MKLYPNPALLRRCGDWEFYESGNKSSVTQPAVFASIAKLEEELGVKLSLKRPRACTSNPRGRVSLQTPPKMTSYRAELPF
jgi:hypothetical protein